MNLKKIQRETTKTIEETAKELGIPKSTFNQYIVEYNEPKISMLIKLANYYNVSVDYLIGRESENTLITKNYQEKKQLLQISEKLNYNNFMKLLVYATALLDGQEG